jgi:putative endonuclease
MASRSNQDDNRKRWKGFIRPGQLIWKLSDAARQFRERQTLSASAALGKRGEDFAHRHLRREGFTVLARNYRPNPGKAEVDIVAQERDIFVFVEVKSRATDEFGSPDRAIGEDKERRIVAAARSYTTKAGIAWSKVRFDTISIVFGGTPSITHQRDAFFRGRAH